MAEDVPGQGPPDASLTAERGAAMGRLRDLASRGDLPMDDFSTAVDQVLAAPDFDALQAVMAPLPPLVRLTPPSLRLNHSLSIDAGAGHVSFGQGWQLAAVTEVRTTSGRCDLDLTQATWDSHDVELRLHSHWGVIEVVVPEGVAVQVISARGSVELDNLDPPLAGAPHVRVTASGGGTVRIRHPRPPRSRRIRDRLRSSLQRRLR